MRRLLGFSLLLFDAVLVVVFLLAYAARYIPPWHIWWAELLAIGLPYLSLLVVVLLGVLLVGRRWKLALVHVVLVVLILIRFIPTPWVPSRSEHPDDLVLLTLNMPGSDALGATPERQEAALRDLLADFQPDMAAFQEAAHLFGLLGQRQVRLASASGETSLYHFAAPLGATKPWYVGKPLLTRLETGDVGLIYLREDGHRDDDASYIVRSEIEWQGRRAVHYNIHLQSFKLPENYPTNVGVLSPRAWLVRVLSSKEAIISRAREAGIIGQRIREETLPVIVTGDFNSTAHSWTFRTIAEGFTDAFRTAGQGWGATWHARFPFARIDFVLVSPEWEVVSADVPDVVISDHRPLVARLRWRDGVSNSD